jgi:bifunctional non-homologous end joining protein LigD
LRREPVEVRKATLKGLLRRSRPGAASNRHFEVDGTVVYEQACALGCEGIVSKRLGSPYRSGRNDSWIKIKNPAARRQSASIKRIGRSEGPHRTVMKEAAY